MSRRTLAPALVALLLAFGGATACSDADSPTIEGDGSSDGGQVDVTPDDLGEGSSGGEDDAPEAPDGGQEPGADNPDVTPDDVGE